MKLDIYKNREIVRTYTAETADITFGVMEDLANAMDLDGLNSGSNAEIMTAAAKLVFGSMETVKELLKQIFDGISDEEIRGARLTDICGVFAEAAQYTFTEISKRITRKN